MRKLTMGKLDLEKLTFENWLEPNSIMPMFNIRNSDGTLRIKTAKEWFEQIYKIKLSKKVPGEIHDLFEVARGTMTYGYFYYPIYSLAAEQFFRIAETAISLKCQSLEMPSTIRSFQRKIEWLSKELKFTKMDIVKWNAFRDLRNIFSHPKEQFLKLPGQAVNSMNITARQINQLFNSRK
jgi:hypothetical protein